MNATGKTLISSFVSCLLVVPVWAQQEVSTSMSYDATVTQKADVIYYDAVKELMLGKNAQAEDLFLQFLKIKPNEPAAFYELSRINTELNKPERSEDYIKKAIELDSNNKWYREQYVAILVNKNDFATAADMLDKLSKKERRSKDYLMNASILYQKAGKDDEALRELNKALSTGADEDILVRKQQIFAKQNKVDSITAVIEQLINVDPQEGKYYALLAETYDNNGQHDKANMVYAKAIKNIPNDPGIQLSLAEHYRKIGDTVQFMAYLKKAITNREIDVQTQLELLFGYIRTTAEDADRLKQAMVMMQQIVAEHPNDARVLSAYGYIFVLNKEQEKGVEQYKRSIAIDPSKLFVWEQVLRAYAGKKDADSLLLYSQKALRLFPNQAQVHFLQGIGYMNKQNYAEAIKSVNRGIDMEPEQDTLDLVQMYSILGDLYNNTKQYHLSDSALTHALLLKPDDAGTLNNYAYYLSVRGERLPYAEQMSARSLILQKNSPTFLDTYGWILYKEGKYDKAKEYIEKAINGDPNADGTVWAHLGDVYYKLGMTEKAVECWQQ